MMNAISLIGLVIVFVLAYSFDRWTIALQQTATRPFTIVSFLWLSSIANLILAGALLLLAWFVNFRAVNSKLVSVTFVIIGVLVTFASALIFTTLYTLPPLGIAEFLTPNSRVVFVGALIAILGLAGLIPLESRSI